MNSNQHQILLRFLPNPLPSGNEKLPLASNPIPYPKYLYLSKSAFLVNSKHPLYTTTNLPNRQYEYSLSFYE